MTSGRIAAKSHATNAFSMEKFFFVLEQSEVRLRV
jgi:hypothetical protein